MEWRSWSGLESARPARVLHPVDTDAVATAVARARDEGTPVKMVGTGHSFTGIARPEHTLLSPRRLTGLVAVDRDAMTATVRAGTPLHVLNAELEAHGLSLHNMGDIAEQTVAGAISTGTHGAGGVTAGLAAQVAALELVNGEGEVLRATATENPDVLDLARVGLGALGVLTTVTFRVEPIFLLEATEEPMSWDRALGSFDELVDTHHHVDLYWFPHTDRLLTKRNDRLAAPVAEAAPLPRWRAWLDDELLANTLFGAVLAGANRVPAVIPRMNRVNARLLSARTYSDVAHRVLTSPRRVVFREMEYAVPREQGLAALREARRVIERSGWRVGFPVEIRAAPADDVPLSTAYERDTVYLAFHTHRDADHTAYFAGVEPVLRAHGGRPHWGKLHSLGAEELADLYPRFADFLALRERLDPARLFGNAYLRRTLGD
ncbi:D-arabinono-1,4-lactone oxidase [Nocardioides sp. GCM10027113]|uniref:D-arabinono-1,4-lactone oxidase n=1 Tax=unclassified Nocardioides TaxID=2615069 RepID=UPI00361B6EEC